MDWTALDLSDLPLNTTAWNNIIIQGDQVYYLKGGDIYRQKLASGEGKELFYSGSPVDYFQIVAGQLLFSNSTGTYKVSSAGAAAELVSTNITVADSISF